MKTNQIAQIPFPRNALQTAFTLIELLAIMATLVILAGLFLPAMTRATNKAHSLLCLNNLKQLQLGWKVYAEDNDEKLLCLTALFGAPMVSRVLD